MDIIKKMLCNENSKCMTIDIMTYLLVSVFILYVIINHYELESMTSKKKV